MTEIRTRKGMTIRGGEMIHLTLQGGVALWDEVLETLTTASLTASAADRREIDLAVKGAEAAKLIAQRALAKAVMTQSVMALNRNV